MDNDAGLISVLEKHFYFYEHNLKLYDLLKLKVHFIKKNTQSYLWWE